MSRFKSQSSNRFGTISLSNYDAKYSQFAITPIIQQEKPEEEQPIEIEQIYPITNDNSTQTNPMIEEKVTEATLERKQSVKLKEVVEFIIAKEKYDKIIRKKNWN